MGIALFTLSSLLTPLQGLVTRLMPVHRQRAARMLRRPPHPVIPDGTAAARTVSGAESTACKAGTALGNNSGLQLRRALPLRVVRVIDSGMPIGCTGRMKISGRMADVCAELDRLAAMEAAM